jgi:hypothetical protein
MLGKEPGTKTARSQNMTTHQEHRDNNGQYTYSSLDRLCVCGARLGAHDAGSKRGQAGGCDDTGCEKFKAARIKK